MEDITKLEKYSIAYTLCLKLLKYHKHSKSDKK